MQREKVVQKSTFLGRTFHADAFTTERPPQVFVLFFGGSGITREEYERRKDSIVTVFDSAFAGLDGASAFSLVFITAPYDLPFSDFNAHPLEAERWQQHVLQDLFCLRPDLPVYLIGYSGGIALALHGLHEHPRCIGVGGLGADGLREKLNHGESWREAIRLYYNVADPLFERNRDFVHRLEEAGTVRCWRQQPGGHELRDYVANGSFSGLVRRAVMLAQDQSA